MNLPFNLSVHLVLTKSTPKGVTGGQETQKEKLGV